MKASEALKRVKERMLDDSQYTSRYICDNLWCVALPTTRRRVERHINKLLDGHFSLHEWLHERGHLPNAQVYPSGCVSISDFDKAKMQRTRMLWIDDMIKHFKSKGD